MRHVFLFFALLATLASARAATVTGEVLAPDAKPVAGATVVITADDSWDTFLTQKTDALGKFSFDIKAPETDSPYAKRVTVFAPQYALAETYIPPGKSAVVRLQPAAQIEGKVTDDKGQPVADAIIKLSSIMSSERTGPDGFPAMMASVPEPLQSQFTTKTGVDGRWVITNVMSAGKASLRLEDPRFVKVWIQANLGAGPVPPTIARPGATIAGRLQYENGKPAAKMEVSAIGQGQGSASGKTADDGSYRLTGLPAGSFNITVRDTTGEWVAVPLEHVATKTGQTTKAADITLTRGAIIEGTVTDQDSGAPLPGTQIGNSRAGAYSSASSDKLGRYKLRVPPGKNGIYIMGLPQGYLNPESGSPSRVLSVELKQGETKTLPFQLEKGVTLTGTAVDTDGKPATGALIAVRVEGADSDFGGRYSASVDDKGQWSISGLTRGRGRLLAQGEWRLVGTSDVVLPSAQPLKVTLRKAALPTLTGRVVTPAGQPVAGVEVELNVSIPQGGGTSIGHREEVTSDAQGRFTLAKIDPEANGITLKASKAAHRFVSGGKVDKQGETFQVQDVILLPLTAKLAGRVTNAAGTAIAGAQVLALEGLPAARANTDNTGNFSLQSLPEGRVTVIAAKGTQIGEAQVTSGAAPVTIALAPPRPVTAENRAAGLNMLKDLLKEGRANRADYFAEMLLPYDFEQAIALGTSPGGTLSESALSRIISKLIETDPQRAAQWVPERLPQIKNISTRFYYMTSLGETVAGFKPELAATMYAQSKAMLPEVIASRNNIDSFFEYLSLAKLAARLKNPDADDYFKKAVTEALRSPRNNAHKTQPVMRSNDLLRNVVEALELANSPLAEKAAADLNDDEKAQVLSSAIMHLTHASRSSNGMIPAQNPPTLEEIQAARRLLDRLDKMPNQNAEFQYGFAAQAIIQAIGKTDPAGALAIARKVTDQFSAAMALAYAARFQPRAEAVKLFREAASKVPAGWTRNMVLVAALAYEVNETVGRELFLRAREMVEADLTNPEKDRPGVNSEVPRFAILYSRVNPIESRLLVEREFARQQQRPLAHGWAGMNQSELVGAMAAINLDRARAMLDLLPGDKDSGMRYDAQVRIVRSLLSPAAVREAALSRY